MTPRLLALLVLAACKQDYCERDEENDLACEREHPKETTKACQDDLKACTNDDAAVLDRYEDCYEDAGAHLCDPEPQAYIDALDCLPILDDLSDACVAVRSSWTAPT